MINILRTVVSRVKRMSAEGRFSVRCAENCGNDRLHRRDNRPRYHEDRLHSLWSRQLTVMATVFVVKNRIPHSRKPFFR